MDIPVIDFKDIGLHNKDGNTISSKDMEAVGLRVKEVLSTVGFCYLKNHGIDQSLLDSYFSVSRDFFNQPIGLKEKYTRGTDLNFGWVAVEREKLNPERPGDLKEAFNYCPADDPGNWPDVEEFQQTSKAMFDQCTNLSLRLCDALSVGLGLDKTFMRSAHEFIGEKKNQTAIRSLFYPPLSPESPVKPGQIRLGEHSDYGTITLLFQDDIGGLEVNIPGKGYVPATPIEGTVVVNVGDLMQRWTADALVATKHRVLIPEAEIKKRKSRQSVVFFVQPDDDFVVKCLDGSNKYEPISSIDYLNYRFSVTY